MKAVLLRFLILTTLSATVTTTLAAPLPGNAASGKVFHVVVIWLKQHGDAHARQQYIEGSKRLAKMPGVLSYNIGTVAAVEREKPSHAVDDSYDVAVSSAFANKQALEDYLRNPEHHKVVQEVLKPLVEKYKVYDFVE
jgi:hypothetical protein